MAFDHDKLEVYQLALEFAARADVLIDSFPRGRGYLADQLQRAALSIVLNIAEGAGRFSPADKASFYTRSRASATESAAVLDVCVKCKVLTAPLADQNKALLDRIAQMLTKLIKSKRPST